MPSTGQIAILQEIRSTIAGMKTTRDSNKYFLQHLTNDPFEKSPIAGNGDGFYVVSGRAEQTTAFGRAGTKEMEWIVTILLGTAPFTTDPVREENMTRDVDRIKDVLEFRTWSAAGVQAVWPLGEEETDRSSASWWITRIPFRFVFTEAIATQ